MLRITELKKDTLIELDSIPFRVVSYSHTSMGRGGATVKVKIKNLINGSVLERTFKNDEKIEPANLERQKVQYLYSTNDKIFLMDMDSFDQIEIPKTVEKNLEKYFAEGSEIQALTSDGKIISFDLPKNVILKVTHAEKGEKGNTANSPTKIIQLETGLEIAAPLFIKEGDEVKVDTRSGQYLERSK